MYLDKLCNTAYLDLRVLRSVTMLFAEAFAALHFKSNYFVTFYQFVKYFGFYDSLYISTGGKITAVINQQYITEFYCIAAFARQMWYIQAITLLYSELLTCYFYNCKHNFSKIRAAKVRIL